jgi:hypothetical protein
MNCKLVAALPFCKGNSNRQDREFVPLESGSTFPARNFGWYCYLFRNKYRRTHHLLGLKKGELSVMNHRIKTEFFELFHTPVLSVGGPSRAAPQAWMTPQQVWKVQSFKEQMGASSRKRQRTQESLVELGNSFMVLHQADEDDKDRYLDMVEDLSKPAALQPGAPALLALTNDVEQGAPALALTDDVGPLPKSSPFGPRIAPMIK